MTTVRRRARAKAAAQVEARYDAGGNGRRIASWRPPSSGPRNALQGFERVRDRVHDAVRNDWAGESSVGKWTVALVGTGIQPHFKNPDHEAIWEDWRPTADADSVLDAYGLQVLGARALFDGGEVFLRRRPRSASSRLDIPVQVQVIEGAYCPMIDNDAYPGMPAGNVMRQGIEMTRYGERVAYWFYREHPGDRPVTGALDLIRVAASQVSHVYEVTRPGMLRGVSPLSTILTRLRASGDLQDASLDRQRLANLFALIITKQLPTDLDEAQRDPLTGMPKAWTAAGQATVGLEPGAGIELRPGEDAKFAQPPGPGAGYAEFQRDLNLGIAAGQHLPYELLTGDLKDVSDRTLRVIINEFRRYCQQRQWITLIPRLCQPMVRWCMETAVMVGRLPLRQFKEASRPEWNPQGWEYIHPVQDAQGKELLLKNGIISRSQWIRERGDKPAAVFDQLERDREELERRGLALDAVDPAAQPAADDTDPSDDPAPPLAQRRPRAALPPAPPAPTAGPEVAAALTSLAGIVAQMQATNTAVINALAGIAQQLAAPQAVHVHPPAAAAPVVHVTTPEQPAPVVNVAVPGQPAPVVNVAVPEQPAPVVNVPAPIVNVQNDNHVAVELPDRQTTSVIERDASGNIVNVTQTERTLQ